MTCRCRMTLSLFFVVLIASALGCVDGSLGKPPAEEDETVVGFVKEVKSRSLLELEALVLVDKNGKRWTFEASDRQIDGFTPSHLKEHMVLGILVRVTFYRKNGEMVIRDITD